MVKRVEDHPQAELASELGHLGEREDSIVVLEHQPRLRRGREPLEAGAKASRCRLQPARSPTAVQHDDRLGTESHRVQDRGVNLELCGGGVADRLVLGVEDRVLPRMKREPHPQLSGEAAHAGELRLALGDLPVEPDQLGMAGVGGERARHPVHPDLVSLQVAQDRLEALERKTQVRPRLPAAGVVRGQPAVPQHLDREAEAH